MIGELDEIINNIVPALKNFSDNPVLLVEENFIITKDGYLSNRNDHRETQMLATSYYGYLETVRKMGLDVVATRGFNESIWWLVGMHGYLAKNHYPKHRKFFSVQEQLVGMITSIPTIGESRANKALLTATLEEMCKLTKIEGLTESQSNKLHKVLHYRMSKTDIQ